MKFLTLEAGQLGVLVDNLVVDLPKAAAALMEPLPADTLESLVVAGDDAAGRAWKIAGMAIEKQTACRLFVEVRPAAPIPVPRRNILCLGKNYLDHAREIARKMRTSSDVPAKPIFFTKATTAVIAPGEPVPSYPGITRKLDYEAELALIVGKGGRDIAASDAWQHVFGYTAMNDISARDLQKDHGQWFRAKSLDGFAPMGPVVVHRSAMPEPENIEIKCTINGELRQCATFDQLIFDVPAIISVLSEWHDAVAGRHNSHRDTRRCGDGIFAAEVSAGG